MKSVNRISVITTVCEFRADLRNRDSPITNYVVLAICFVFLAQETAAAFLGASILGVTMYFFLEYPVPAWLLTFFLHASLAHFFANVAIIGFLGRVVEPEFSTQAYLSFLAGTAILSAVGAFLAKAPFTSDPVAAYGASGVGFALAAYSLSFPCRDGEGVLDALRRRNVRVDTTPAEYVAFLFGVAAVSMVVFDLFTGPYLTAEWVNGAHLVGIVVGIVATR